MATTITKMRIMRSIKKYLKEQEGGLARYTGLLKFVVYEECIASEKWAKICIRELVDEKKIHKVDRRESFRTTGVRQPYYCMPNWAEKENITKKDSNELRKSRAAVVAKLKKKIGKISDSALTVAVFNEYSRLSDLNSRLRIHQEFTGDRASPEYKILVETIPKMVEELFTVFDPPKVSKKRKESMVDDLLSLFAENPFLLIVDLEHAKDVPGYYEVVEADGTSIKDKLLPNLR